MEKELEKIKDELERYLALELQVNKSFALLMFAYLRSIRVVLFANEIDFKLLNESQDKADSVEIMHAGKRVIVELHGSEESCVVAGLVELKGYISYCVLCGKQILLFGDVGQFEMRFDMTRLREVDELVKVYFWIRMEQIFKDVFEKLLQG